jgi:hypothetical protein
MNGEKRNANRLLMGKADGKLPLGRARHRQIYIRIYLREKTWGGMGWIYLTEDKDQWRVLLNMVKNL